MVGDWQCAGCGARNARRSLDCYYCRDTFADGVFVRGVGEEVVLARRLRFEVGARGGGGGLGPMAPALLEFLC